MTGDSVSLRLTEVNWRNGRFTVKPLGLCQSEECGEEQQRWHRANRSP